MNPAKKKQSVISWVFPKIGRINRRTFFVSSFILGVLSLPIEKIPLDGSIFSIVTIVLYLIIFFIGIRIFVLRGNDCGFSKNILIFLIIIPYILLLASSFIPNVGYLYLLFSPYILLLGAMQGLYGLLLLLYPGKKLPTVHGTQTLPKLELNTIIKS